MGEEATDDGVDGNDILEGGGRTGAGKTCRSGEAVRRCPREAPSCCNFSDPSRTEDRMGEVGGNASSTGFLRWRTRFGEPWGLDGRRSGEDRERLARSKPGIDLVRDMLGRLRLAVDLDRVWVPARGDVVLGLYGRLKVGG